MTPRIICAALSNGTITISAPAPARHKDIFLAAQALMPDTDVMAAFTQGFLTSNGTFLNRRESLFVASMAGQITPDILLSARELNTEMLW